MSIYNQLHKLIKATREKKIIPIVTQKDNTELLRGKTAFISGGSGGIGKAIAKALIESGCRVILGGTDYTKLEKCKQELKKTSEINIETVLFDMNSIKEFSDIVDNLFNKYSSIDIFVSSVGVHTDNLDFWKLKTDEFDRVMDINLKGPYFACIEMAKHMRQNNTRGHMLIISSSRGFEPAWSPYGISKWALNGMIQGLAQQFMEYGITINGIAPGPTATNLIGISDGDSVFSEETKGKRLLMPGEIAELARLMVSDTGEMLSGEVIRFSGGRGVFDIR